MSSYVTPFERWVWQQFSKGLDTWEIARAHCLTHGRIFDRAQEPAVYNALANYQDKMWRGERP